MRIGLCGGGEVTSNLILVQSFCETDIRMPKRNSKPTTSLLTFNTYLCLIANIIKQHCSSGGGVHRPQLII